MTKNADSHNCTATLITGPLPSNVLHTSLQVAILSIFSQFTIYRYSNFLITDTTTMAPHLIHNHINKLHNISLLIAKVYNLEIVPVDSFCSQKQTHFQQKNVSSQNKTLGIIKSSASIKSCG